MQFLAEASTNSHPNSRASACPSCVETSRSVTLSLLFPTSIMGTGADGAADDNGDPGYDGEDADDSLTRWIWL